MEPFPQDLAMQTFPRRRERGKRQKLMTILKRKIWKQKKTALPFFFIKGLSFLDYRTQIINSCTKD